MSTEIDIDMISEDDVEHVLPPQTNDDTIEAFKSYVKSNSTADSDIDRTSNKVTKIECELIRDMHGDGVSPSEIIRYFYHIKSTTTIHYNHLLDGSV